MFVQAPLFPLKWSVYEIFFLAHRIRISDILSLVRNSYLTHAILPRLSQEGRLMAVLDLKHMVVK